MFADSDKLKMIKFNDVIETIVPKIPKVFFIVTMIGYILSKIPELLKISLVSDAYIWFESIRIFLEQNIFVSTRMGSLATIAVVLIGFYITVISVFGSGYSCATISISENGLGKKFISYVENSILSAFLFFIMTIFYDTISWDYFTWLYSSVFLWLLVEFIRFTTIVLRMYYVNIENSASIVEDEKKHNLEILSLLREIRNSGDSRKESVQQTCDLMREEMDKRRSEAPKLPFDENI